MAESWINLERKRGADKPQTAIGEGEFLATIPRVEGRVAVTEQELLSTLPPVPTAVFADQEKINRARTLSATLDMPFSQAYEGELILSQEAEARYPGFFKQTKEDLKVGTGDMYVAAARALEWLGFPDAAKPYLDFGNRLREGYMPPLGEG